MQFICLSFQCHIRIYIVTEDTLWVQFVNRTMEALFAAIDYIPPVGSSRDVDAEERFQVLSEQVWQYQV